VKRVNVAVAVAEEALGRLPEVAAACRAFGFEHDSTLPTVGVLTGSIDINSLRALRTVPGVVVVAMERALRPIKPNGKI
jgi:hypothetical protein